jgi:hypothetical protein
MKILIQILTFSPQNPKLTSSLMFEDFGSVAQSGLLRELQTMHSMALPFKKNISHYPKSIHSMPNSLNPTDTRMRKNTLRMHLIILELLFNEIRQFLQKKFFHLIIAL